MEIRCQNIKLSSPILFLTLPKWNKSRACGGLSSYPFIIHLYFVFILFARLFYFYFLVFFFFLSFVWFFLFSLSDYASSFWVSRKVLNNARQEFYLLQRFWFKMDSSDVFHLRFLGVFRMFFIFYVLRDALESLILFFYMLFLCLSNCNCYFASLLSIA